MKGWVREGDFIRRYRRIFATILNDAAGAGVASVYPVALTGAHFHVTHIMAIRSDFVATGNALAFLNGTGPLDCIWGGTPSVFQGELPGSNRVASTEQIGLRTIGAGNNLIVSFTIWGYDELPADAAGLIPGLDDDEDAEEAIEADEEETDYDESFAYSETS